MSNRLAEATSPYLLQHAHNPVDWQPWELIAENTCEHFQDHLPEVSALANS